MEKKFIIWGPIDEDPPGRGPSRDEEGCINSDGIIGRVGEDNVYLTTYASYRKEGVMDKFGRKSWPCSHKELEVGEWTEATFSLSGSKGTYQIWRVQ